MKRHLFLMLLALLMVSFPVTFVSAQNNQMGMNHMGMMNGDSTQTMHNSDMNRHMMSDSTTMNMMGQGQMMNQVSMQSRMISDDFAKLEQHFRKMMEIDDLAKLKTEMQKHMGMMNAMQKEMMQHRNTVEKLSGDDNAAGKQSNANKK